MSQYTNKHEDAHCAWCGRDISTNNRGRKRKYCSQSCRQRTYEARHNLIQHGLSPDCVVLTQSDTDAIIDRIFQARCAAEDLLTAISEGATSEELQEIATEVVALSREAERIR